MKHLFRKRALSLMLAALFLVTEMCGGRFACKTAEASDSETKQIPKIESILGGGPAISGKAGVVMEVHSNAVLFAKNATESMSPTSLTKLLTALLILEDGRLTDTVNCSYASINSIGKNVTRVGLVVNERIAAIDLLNASLVASADEATYALAEHVGGSMRKFLKMMNERMTQLGAVNSNFTSCTGTGGSKQLSCAYDIGLVACKLGTRADFLQIAGAKWYKIPQSNLKEARTIAQTHKFIRQTIKYDYAIAGKSGGKAEDGTYSLCTYAEKDGMRLVAIVLGSASDESAYDDTITMLSYAFENYKSYSMRNAERIGNPNYAGFFDECPMFTGKDYSTLSIASGATIVVPLDTDLTKLEKRVEYSIPEDYVHGENVIGQLIYSYNGALVGRTDIIYYNEEYPFSQKDFDAIWPKFLLPPSMLKSTGGEGTESVIRISGEKKATPTPTPLPKSMERWEGQSRKEAGTRAGIIGLAVFLVLLLVIYIVAPMIVMARKPKKNLRRR
ncbi:MAG: D-alanyl-D-alanine carboxypeptidase [Lachnospiraceae bacterium]|nr:D-alanyl-D-alanine carboxypeptidase [Lachnospiraceae bacterium]